METTKKSLAKHSVSRRPNAYRGFSIVELIVAMGIVGILVALLLVAVNSIRSTIRNTACQNKITQIAKAGLNFESANMHFPTGAWQDEILEFLSGTERNTKFTIQENSVIDLFSCPADTSVSFDVRGGGVSRQYGNYQLCYGVWLDVEKKPAGSYYGSTGVVSAYNDSNAKGVRIADISDGLSNTAWTSESLKGVGTQTSTPDALLRLIWVRGEPLKFEENERLADECSKLGDGIPVGWENADNKGVLFENFDGIRVSTTGLGVNLYNHVLPPGSPSCWNSGGGIETGIASATSNHANGSVNVAFCDGHVATFSPSIERLVWRQLGHKSDGGR